MPKIKLSTGISTHYEQHGQGENLLLISGLSSDHTAWLPVLEMLSQKFRVTLFDNRGAGQTDQPQGPYTIGQMAEDTIALLDALHIAQPFIAGHSMGGMILQRLCLDFPERVRKAALCTSLMKLPLPSLLHIQNCIDLLKAGVSLELVCKSTLPWIFGPEFLSDGANVEKALQEMLNNPFPQSLEALESQFTACKSEKLWTLIDGIKTPTLIVAGRDDMLTPIACSEVIHHRIRNSKLVILERCGHKLQLEQPEAFCKTILSIF